MAGRDLRALFSGNDRDVSTAEAFTNRQAQWVLVAAALAEHTAHIAGPGFDVEDLQAPRDNVMVFHGIGGIGGIDRTTLSRKLEAALAGAEHRPAQWGEPVWPASARIQHVRIDLSRPAGGDFEQPNAAEGGVSCQGCARAARTDSSLRAGAGAVVLPRR
ncbi:hypothetical protein ACFV9D_24840 [Streptomyces sp. NPDC059875]|uniref:hypothetical protein n=1 Tax=unclassified Streptomyces TaxID=2593676 RepID=UPI0036494DAB